MTNPPCLVRARCRQKVQPTCTLSRCLLTTASENSGLLRFAYASPNQRDSAFAYRVKEAAFRGYVEQVKEWGETDQRAQHVRRFAE